MARQCMEKKCLELAEKRAEEAEKLTAEATRGKELAEKRADELFEMLEVNIDTKYEMKDAPQSTRSLQFAIICIMLLVTTVIFLAININGRMM